MSQTQLKSGAEANKKNLAGVIEAEDDDEFQVLGFCEWATTGSVLVPRDWLQERWDHYELPESFFPSEVWPSSAYKRSMNYLQDQEFEEIYIDGRKAKFRMEDGDGFIKHVYLDVFFPEDEIGVDGGQWRQNALGFFDYNSTSQSVKFHSEAEGEVAEREWKKLIGKAQGLHEKMKKSHNGTDLNGVLLEFVQSESTAVPLRSGGALYFFPAKYQETLEGLSQLWTELNKFKEIGRECELVTLPVVDSENHREMVRKKAEEMINSKIESVLDAAIDRLSEQEEKTAEEIAESVVENLSETTSMAEEYSQLLETKLSIKRNLNDYLNSLEGEKEELANQIAEEVEID